MCLKGSSSDALHWHIKEARTHLWRRETIERNVVFSQWRRESGGDLSGRRGGTFDAEIYEMKPE